MTLHTVTEFREQCVQLLDDVPPQGIGVPQPELLDFTSDPADEIIAATSLAFKIPLLTRDTNILTSHVLKFP